MIRFITFIIIAGVVYWLWKWTMNRYERVKNDYLGRGVPKEGEQGKMSELVQDILQRIRRLHIRSNSSAAKNAVRPLIIQKQMEEINEIFYRYRRY